MSKLITRIKVVLTAAPTYLVLFSTAVSLASSQVAELLPGQAEAIIETQVGTFLHWMHSRENVPLIRALREMAEREEKTGERSLSRRLRGAEAKIADLRDKAIRYDLDEAGITQREREAVELVELRAELAAVKAEPLSIGAIPVESGASDVPEAKIRHVEQAARA